MDLIIVFGPPASGKMTVGQALQKQRTGYKLFYNHLSLELVNQFFDFGTSDFRQLDRKIRFAIFEAIAASPIEGLIFTFVWAFGFESDQKYVDDIVRIFEARQASVYFVELKCDLAERLIRNKHEHRLQHKPSKRDTNFSEKLLLEQEKIYRMNSEDGELKDRNVLKIDNTKLSAIEVAEQVVQHFQLSTTL